MILCGGRGTRMGADTGQIPKPMLPIGGRPALWHVMAGFARHGHRDFVLPLGWLGDVIRRWVLQIRPLLWDFTLDVDTGHVELLDDPGLDGWRITCIDTGETTETGGRVLQVARRVAAQRLIVAYGDTLSDIDIDALVAFHNAHAKPATVTAVAAPSRWGTLELGTDGEVRAFREKPRHGQPLINGGFIVLDSPVLDQFRYQPQLILERGVLPVLARQGQLAAYHHTGYWATMDTPAERDELNRLWTAGAAPWATRPVPNGHPARRP